jgi:hypothetical protein
MFRSRFYVALLRLGLPLALAGCGGGGGGSSDAQPAVSTLAYVVSDCRSDGPALTLRQSLQIRQGEQAPITLVEHATERSDGGAICGGVGLIRQSTLFGEFGVFRRLGVSPDGSQVVFEITDEVYQGVDNQLVFPFNALPAEQKGIFVVGADGNGLRRLGPASRVASFWLSFFVFSPSGRTIAYTDDGPDRTGANAVQIFMLDLLTGERRQVTQLPPATGNFGGVYQPFFNDEHTITFNTWSNADGNHPEGNNLVVTINTDGTGLRVAPPVVALPGAEVLTSFRITGSELDAAVLTVSGTPLNPGAAGQLVIHEVFDIDRDNNVLQLTNFGRADTQTPAVSADGERVLFSASADPLGTNPTENCQIFSIDRSGGDLRQLTDFREVADGERSALGCSFLPKPLGCGAYSARPDARTGAILFYSMCDPLGTNPNGGQVFAMHADGTGLRQLTTTSGYMRDASGIVRVEMLFPFAWPGLEFRNQITPARLRQPGVQSDQSARSAE